MKKLYILGEKWVDNAKKTVCVSLPLVSTHRHIRWITLGILKLGQLLSGVLGTLFYTRKARGEFYQNSGKP